MVQHGAHTNHSNAAHTEAARTSKRDRHATTDRARIKACTDPTIPRAGNTETQVRTTRITHDKCYDMHNPSPFPFTSITTSERQHHLAHGSQHTQSKHARSPMSLPVNALSHGCALVSRCSQNNSLRLQWLPPHMRGTAITRTIILCRTGRG